MSLTGDEGGERRPIWANISMLESSQESTKGICPSPLVLQAGGKGVAPSFQGRDAKDRNGNTAAPGSNHKAFFHRFWKYTYFHVYLYCLKDIMLTSSEGKLLGKKENINICILQA